MERLTARDKNDNVIQMTVSNTGRSFHSDEVWNKLAAYEDTELTPERVTELAQAEQCIVELTGKIKDCLVTILGASEYIKPGTGVYMTTQIALDYIAKAEAALTKP